MAQPKIQVVFNIGQKNGSISGRLLGKPASGQKNGLIYGHRRQKAGGASPWAQLAQPVLRSWLAYLPAVVPAPCKHPHEIFARRQLFCWYSVICVPRFYTVAVCLLRQRLFHAVDNLSLDAEPVVGAGVCEAVLGVVAP